MLWGAFLALIASVSWGAMFPVANHSFQYIDSFYFTIFRYIPVAIILVIILWMKEGKQAFNIKGRNLPLWFFSGGFAVYNLFIFWGQEMLGESGVLLASIMESLMPLISVLIIWAFKKQRPSLYTLSFIGLAFIGVFLVVTNGDLNFLLTLDKNFFPLLILFIAVIGWVLYTMGGDHFPDWSILRYSTLSCLFGTSAATVVVLITTAFGGIEAPTIQEAFAVRYDMAFMVIFPGLIALIGWNIGVRILKPINGLLFITFVPVTTVIIGFIQGYDLTAFDLIGTLFIVSALVLNNVYQRFLLKRMAKRTGYDETAA
ncbi:MAG TPA: DMT family transporter [Bacillota bacterium]